MSSEDNERHFVIRRRWRSKDGEGYIWFRCWPPPHEQPQLYEVEVQIGGYEWCPDMFKATRMSADDAASFALQLEDISLEGCEVFDVGFACLVDK